MKGYRSNILRNVWIGEVWTWQLVKFINDIKDENMSEGVGMCDSF